MRIYLFLEKTLTKRILKKDGFLQNINELFLRNLSLFIVWRLFTFSKHPAVVKRLSIQWKGNILQEKTKYCKYLHRNRIQPIVFLTPCFSKKYQNSKKNNYCKDFHRHRIQPIFFQTLCFSKKIKIVKETTNVKISI